MGWVVGKKWLPGCTWRFLLPFWYLWKQIPAARNLPDFLDLRHNAAMEPLFQFALSLLSAGAPWLAAVIVIAIAVDRVGPIQVNLSIGDRADRKNR
jgi:hypothetical protein